MFRPDGMKRMVEGRRIISRLLAAIPGIILLGAGVLKAMDISLFMTQMKAYGVISHPVLLLAGSWGMIILQCTLGMALLLYFRPKWTLTATILLWIILLGGTIWAWATGATGECGCYGSWLKNTPREASVENAVLLLLTVAARFKADIGSGEKERLKAAVLTGTLILGLALPFIFGASISGSLDPEYGLNKIELGIVKPAGLGAVDFGRGTHLVLLMGTDCHHCLELLPEVEMLALTPGLPGMVAFCLDSDEERRRFVEEYQPSFPLGRIDDDLFWKLLGNGSTPRLLLIRQGRIEKIWDQEIPAPEMIQ